MILKEGWLSGTGFAIAAYWSQSLSWFLAAPLWLLVPLTFYVFRDPDREVPSLPLAVVSPVDGKVLSVDTVKDPYIDREAVRITVRMSSLGIYTTRSPIEGKIIDNWIRTPDNPVEGQGDVYHFGMWIQTDEVDDVVLVMERQSTFNSPRCFVHSGERVGQGQRCGFIRFGTLMHIYVPVKSRIDVEAGAAIEAGSSVIATLRHEKDVENPALTGA